MLSLHVASITWCHNGTLCLQMLCLRGRVLVACTGDEGAFTAIRVLRCTRTMLQVCIVCSSALLVRVLFLQLLARHDCALYALCLYLRLPLVTTLNKLCLYNRHCLHVSLQQRH
jgi:hypothetical protein